MRDLPARERTETFPFVAEAFTKANRSEVMSCNGLRRNRAGVVKLKVALSAGGFTRAAGRSR